MKHVLKNSIFLFLILIAFLFIFNNLFLKNKELDLKKNALSYSYKKNAFYINKHIIINPYEISFSNNNTNIIYSKIDLGSAPDIYLMNNKGQNRRITDNDFIEFSPVINDLGDFAYALSKYSVAESEVFLNGEILNISEDNALNMHLSINDKYLAFSEINTRTEENNLVIYNIQNQKFKKVFIEGIISNIEFIDEDQLLLQIYSEKTCSMNIWTYDINNGKLDKLIETEHDEIIREVNYSQGYEIDTIKGDSNTRNLFNAYYSLYNYKLANPFSLSNDFLGRLSWNQSTRLEGLIKLYKVTQDNLVKEQINTICKNILNIDNENLNVSDEINPPYLWASKKYSINQQEPLSLLVNNSKIMNALLFAVEEDVIREASIKEDIISRAENMFEFYNQQYNKSEKLYFVPKGVAYKYDGIWLPFNQQNIYGLVLLRLYNITGNEEYKLRVFELADKFKSEWTYTDDGQVLWRYWPQSFYNGWDESDHLSINTPSYHGQPSSYEDVSHAGINVKFIIDFYKSFHEDIFTKKDIDKLNNTYQKIFTESKYFKYIGEEATSSRTRIAGYPIYGWLELEDPIFMNNKNFIPTIYPDFDSYNLYPYTWLIKDELRVDDSITILTKEFNLNNELISTSDKEYNYLNIKTYFEH